MCGDLSHLKRIHSHMKTAFFLKSWVSLRTEIITIKGKERGNETRIPGSIWTNFMPHNGFIYYCPIKRVAHHPGGPFLLSLLFSSCPYIQNMWGWKRKPFRVSVTPRPVAGSCGWLRLWFRKLSLQQRHWALVATRRRFSREAVFWGQHSILKVLFLFSCKCDIFKGLCYFIPLLPRRNLSQI